MSKPPFRVKPILEAGSEYMLASYVTPSKRSLGIKGSRPRTMSMATTETASSSTPSVVYLYAGDQIVENVTMGYFYYQDSLGNTSHVTDSGGNPLERYTYDAFGTPTVVSWNAAANTWDEAHPRTWSVYGIRHLFQGQLWTQETGLNDYRNRVELPTMGVFLQPDPIGFKGDAANIYRFCNNNSVNRTDPMGLDTFTAEIQLRPNLDNIDPYINERAFGGTIGTLEVKARLTDGRITVDEVNIHATAYVRTRMRYGSAPTGIVEKNRSKQDIARTARHEVTVHMEPHHERYFHDKKDEIRRDFEDGKTYKQGAGDNQILAKQKEWQEKYRDNYLSEGKKADAGRRAQDSSPDGNAETPSGTTGPKDTSAGALDEALKTLIGIGGGQPGEGVHPRGPN